MHGPTFVEVISDDLSVASALKELHHHHQSKFQSIQVCTLEPWGRALILDNHMQSTQHDEYIYHECLVHPSMLLHPNPKRVFVGGGGEGATVREILRHKSVEQVVMVDIDGECVDMCRKHLPLHHQGAFDDPRTTLVIDDAKVYLEKCPEKFDVMFFDLSDPIDEGPAYLLYTKSFYEMCIGKLNPGGIFVTQSGPAGALTHTLCFTGINYTLKSVFSNVFAYSAHIPSYTDMWGWNAGSNSSSFNPVSSTKEEIDRLIGERLSDPTILKFYDGLMHQAIFTLPKLIRKSLAEETRYITEDAPHVIP